MLKRIWLWFILPLAILLIFLIIVGSLIPKEFYQAHTYYSCSQDYDHHCCGIFSFLICKITWGAVFIKWHSDFFIMFFTGIIAFYTISLWWEAKTSSEKELRAYIFVKDMGIMNVANPIQPPVGILPDAPPEGYAGRIVFQNQGPSTTYSIKNFGKTPAYKVSHLAAIDVREYPLTTPLETPHSNEPWTTPIPPEGITTKTLRYPSPLDPSQLQGIQNGTLAIYIWGRITYLDAYNRSHITNYRLFHNSVVGYTGISTDMRHCSQGNDAN